MHSRVMHISGFRDDSARPENRESVVRFSRRWATATTPERVLSRHRETNRWSHGGGLFTDERTGEQFVLQAIWPVVHEPGLWIEDREPDLGGSYSWSMPRVKTDAEAASRIEDLERAEGHKRTRERLKPKAAGEGRLSIRLMVEYSVDWPLWGDDGPMEPWELGLSSGLTERLRVWNQLWQTQHHYDSGWKTNDDWKRFKRDETSLVADLANEVRPFADVTPFEN